MHCTTFPTISITAFRLGVQNLSARSRRRSQQSAFFRPENGVIHLNCTFQVSHAGNYLEKQGAFIEEINAKIWAIDGTELPDARSAAKEAVEVQLQRNFFRSRNIVSSVVHELQVLGGVQESLTGTGLVKPLRS